MPRSARMSAETRQIVWQALRPLLRPHRRAFTWVFLLTLAGSSFGLVEPIVYREVVNDVSGLYVRHAYENSGATGHPSADTSKKHQQGHVAARTVEQALSTLIWAVVILTLTGALSRLCYLAADTRSTRAASRIEQSFVLKTFEHVLRLPLTYLSRRGSGKLAQRVDQSDAVAPILTSFAQELLPELISFVGIFSVMATQNWRLTLIALATVPPYVYVARLSSRRLEQTATAYYQQWDAVSAHLSEKLAGVKTVKLSGAEQREVEALGGEMGAAYDSYISRNQAENRYANWQGILVQIGEALVLAVGGYFVLEHELTPGDVVMFVTYLNQVYDPIDQVSSLIATLQEHTVSVARAGRMLQLPAEAGGGAALLPGPGRVEFRDVHFGYRPEREVLRGVSFVLEPGRTTALVGPSGAGKTTSSDLLLRLFEPQSGTICIDGQELRTLNVSELRSAIAVVAVDGTLFNGTLADNIRYRRPSASDTEVEKAANAHARALAGRSVVDGRRPGRGPVRGRAAARTDRAGPLGATARAGAGRGDGQPGLRHAAGGEGRDRARATGRHDAGDRAPLLDGQGCRSRDRAGCGQGGGQRHTRRAAGPRRILRGVRALRRERGGGACRGAGAEAGSGGARSRYGAGRR